jgi:hypothetical protein
VSTLALRLREFPWKKFLSISGLVICAVTAFFVFASKWSHYGSDWLSISTFFVLVAAFVVCIAVTIEDIFGQHEWSVSGLKCLCVMALAVSVVDAGLFPTPTANSESGAVDFWFNVRTSQSTLSRDLLVVRPFSPDIKYVKFLARNPEVDIRLTSHDGIPLLCTGQVGGLLLNVDNPEALVKFLGDVITTGTDPNVYIDSQLDNAIAAAMTKILAPMSTDEIGKRSSFIIPYQVGTPMGDMLKSVFYKWNDGSVYVSCRAVFN